MSSIHDGGVNLGESGLGMLPKVTRAECEDRHGRTKWWLSLLTGTMIATVGIISAAAGVAYTANSLAKDNRREIQAEADMQQIQLDHLKETLFNMRKVQQEDHRNIEMILRKIDGGTR